MEQARELTFLETLKIARDNKILTAKLCVVEEVNGMFPVKDEEIEQLSKLVYSVYLSSDFLEPVHICFALLDFYNKGGSIAEILQLDEDEIIEKSSYYC